MPLKSRFRGTPGRPHVPSADGALVCVQTLEAANHGPPAVELIARAAVFPDHVLVDEE